MASILATSIDLTKIPKDKIIEGKKGKYLPITITVNDEVDQFGNQGPVIVSQTKEERDMKAEKTYLGNAQVVWTNGQFPQPAPRDGGQSPQQASIAAQSVAKEDDLPF